MPAASASSTISCSVGTSTIGSISFGIALVAGRKRVPRPAAGMTALRDACHATVVAGRRTARKASCARACSDDGTVAPAGRCASARGELVVGAHGDAEPPRHVGEPLRAQAIVAGGGRYARLAVDEAQRHGDALGGDDELRARHVVDERIARQPPAAVAAARRAAADRPRPRAARAPPRRATSTARRRAASAARRIRRARRARPRRPHAPSANASAVAVTLNVAAQPSARASAATSARPPPSAISTSAAAAANEVAAHGSGSSRRWPSAPNATFSLVCASPATSAAPNTPSATGTTSTSQRRHELAHRRAHHGIGRRCAAPCLARQRHHARRGRPRHHRRRQRAAGQRRRRGQRRRMRHLAARPRLAQPPRRRRHAPRRHSPSPTLMLSESVAKSLRTMIWFWLSCATSTPPNTGCAQPIAADT